MVQAEKQSHRRAVRDPASIREQPVGSALVRVLRGVHGQSHGAALKTRKRAAALRVQLPAGGSGGLGPSSSSCGSRSTAVQTALNTC